MAKQLSPCARIYAKGQAYLKETKAQIQLPVISKVSKENRAMLSLDIRANQLYQMGDSSLKEQNFGRFPYDFRQIPKNT